MKLTTNEFNNNYKQTSNLTKFRSFALHKKNEKIYRKPHHTLLNTALERLDPQAKQKVNYDISPGSHNTDVFPLLGAFHLSDSALSINVNDHGKAGYLN